MPWVILIIVIAYCFIWVLAPRKMWRITHGWQYKNPEANEPSDAAYAILRIRAIVPIVIIPVAIFGGLFIGVFWFPQLTLYPEGDMRAACPI